MVHFTLVQYNSCERKDATKTEYEKLILLEKFLISVI
jgi:hypothetical protein